MWWNSHSLLTPDIEFFSRSSFNLRNILRKHLFYSMTCFWLTYRSFGTTVFFLQLLFCVDTHRNTMPIHKAPVLYNVELTIFLIILCLGPLSLSREYIHLFAVVYTSIYIYIHIIFDLNWCYIIKFKYIYHIINMNVIIFKVRVVFF